MSDHGNDLAGLEEVEVDKRALVKILSRYPGTFDVLRELIQNADDAEAPSIEVHFESEGDRKPVGELDVSKVNVRKWVIKNGGPGFQEKDWERLGKIAYGNDNSTKVGAFGVGFYSVLSKSDQPLVKSNGKSLQFQRGEDEKLRKWFVDCLPDSQTSIELELREPEPLPVLADLTRFLVSSVAFLTNIKVISVHLDSDRVLYIEKQVESPVKVLIPEHLKPTTPSAALTVESIQRTVQRIAVDATEWAFPSNPSSSSCDAAPTDAVPERSAALPTRNPRSADAILKDNTVKHDLYTAVTRVNLDQGSEMKRGVESSMKSLPPSFECKVVHFNSKQYESLVGIRNSDLPKAKLLARLLFGSQGIIPENDSGRLFIGQSTNQTTGVGLHISAHFLPTMERGSIDLANGQIAAWNKEVLWMSGFLARVIYEEEMTAAKSKSNLATQLGLRTMGRFAFGPTAPDSGVSQVLQDAFFSCCHEPKLPFPVVSDVGISCASHVHFRQCNKDLTFLKTYLVLHDDVEARQRSEIITRYKIPGFTFGDIVREFESGVTYDVMKSFFIWWEDVKKKQLLSSSRDAREKFYKEFPSQGVVRLGDGAEIALKNIRYFTYFQLPGGLSPPDTIYLDATSGAPTRGAVECFGWTQLPLLHWLEYARSRVPRLASSEGSGETSDVGYRILRALVQFALVQDLTSQQWARAADLMEDLECIPTNIGRQLPSNSYFDQADVCGCLPVATETSFRDIPPTPLALHGGFQYKSADTGHVRTVLSRIGVRQWMDWKDMIGRLEAGASKESNHRLLLRAIILFLEGTLTVNDLQERKVFYSENGQKSATELYFPDEEVHKLGLPVLALPRDSMTSLQSIVDQILQSYLVTFSVESFIIRFLGILRYPTLPVIIKLAASDQPGVRGPALQYLLSNLETHYKAYKADNFADYAFIPTECGSLAPPNEVFASPVWKKLGFKQVSDDLSRDRSRLGVKEHPSVDTIIKCFETPERRPSDIDTAKIWFKHLHLDGKLPIPKLREHLSKVPFVPVQSPSEPSSIQYIPPKACLIVSPDTKEHYREIFTFVDFGQDGNSFLESCCAKRLPDASDIVQKIMENPQRYLEALQFKHDLYLDDLRMIASQLDSISPDDKEAMKKAPMFLAFRNSVVAEKLLPAKQILISDWVGRDFGGDAFVAPQDDIITKMYREMGSEFLGTRVQRVVTDRDPDERDPPFTCDQVIRRIEYFMDQRDKGGKKDVLFPLNDLEVKACKNLKLKNRFVPPSGTMADDVEATGTVETEPVPVRAGFESYTLWMDSDPSELVDLYNHIAMTLCHAVLKTYGPNDVLLLASLFAMKDKDLEQYYDKPKPQRAHDAKVKPEESPNKVEVKVSLPVFMAQWIGVRKWSLKTVSRPTIPIEEDMERALASWGESISNAQNPDYSAPDQQHFFSSKKYDKHCKKAHTIKLREKKHLQDKETNIRFFLTQDVHCEQPPKPALEEFATLVSRLAHVFDREEPSTACYIFWKDTDEDLMAFNRDQKYIFLNLAHYHRFFYNKDVERKRVITEWYLIMAHEIAHNLTMDHDEFHGSLSASLAVEHLPSLYRYFPEMRPETEQQPQRT